MTLRSQSEQEARELGELPQVQWLRESADRLEQTIARNVWPARSKRRKALQAEAERRRASAERIENPPMFTVDLDGRRL